MTNNNILSFLDSAVEVPVERVYRCVEAFWPVYAPRMLILAGTLSLVDLHARDALVMFDLFYTRPRRCLYTL